MPLVIVAMILKYIYLSISILNPFSIPYPSVADDPSGETVCSTNGIQITCYSFVVNDDIHKSKERPSLETQSIKSKYPHNTRSHH